MSDELTSTKYLHTIETGICYLDNTQNKADGSWTQGVRLVATSQAALALMAYDQFYDCKRFGRSVRKSVEYILGKQRSDGLIAENGAYLFQHTFCTYFLAKYLNEGGDKKNNPKIKIALQKAVDLIVKLQSRSGGWSEGEPDTDTDSTPVTACSVMALVEARKSGIELRADVLQKAARFIKGCANPDGGFNYRINNVGSAYPRSAAAVCALQMLGEGVAKETKQGLLYLKKIEPDKNASWFYFGNYFAARAFFQNGGNDWNKWHRQVCGLLLKKQLLDGRWVDKDSGGDIYSTGMTMLIFQMPSHASEGKPLNKFRWKEPYSDKKERPNK